MENSQTYKSDSSAQILNPGTFKGVMVGEVENATNIPTQNHQQFALQVDGDAPAGLAYRFVPLKVENEVVDQLDDDLDTLEPMLHSDTVRLTLMNPQENQMFVVNQTNVDSGPRLTRSTPAVLAHKMATAREEKKRVTHNEVERRRRDKINNWICKLAKILPDGGDIPPKTNQSKGGILSKACDYIEELRLKNENFSEQLRYAKDEMENDLRYQELDVLKDENASLRNENAILKAKLKQHGVIIS